MDLIDRKRALEEMTFSGGIEQDGVLYVPLRDVNKHLKNLPSVQLDGELEIIACGDCKHWICHDRRCGYWNHGVKPLDWCSYAERREEPREN